MKRTVLAAALLLALTGCGVATEAATPEETAQPVNETVEIIHFGDGYYDLAIACDGHGHRIYHSTFNTPARPVVIDDPSCPGGSRG